MSAWSYYRLNDGTLLPEQYEGVAPPEALPDGLGVVYGSGIDRLSERVNLQTGELEQYQPPPPPADDLQTWAWDAAIRRWVSQPTLEAHRRPRLAAVEAAFAVLERAQARPMRELATARARLDLPGEASAVQRLQVLDDRAAELRALRQAIFDARDLPALEALPHP